MAICSETLAIGIVPGLKFVNTIIVTADYSVTASDDVILVDASAGEVNITLLPSGVATKSFRVYKIDAEANNVVVLAVGSDLIDGASSKTIFAQNAGYEFIRRLNGYKIG